MKHQTIEYRVDGSEETNSVSGIATQTETGDWKVGNTVIAASDVVVMRDTYTTFEKEVMNGQ